LRQPPDLGAGDALTERRQSVIAATLVVRAGAALLDFDDEPLLDHPRNRSIERAGAQAKVAIGSRLHVLNDGVPVTLALGKREQDVQRGRRKRQEVVGSGFRAHRAQYSHCGYIAPDAGYSLNATMGSMRTARRAGIAQARIETTSNRPAEPNNTMGSVGVTPKSNDWR
jgi:hypothetical protein